jgi:DNA-directed RNA polymerase subunit RPC12/RpoP
MIVPGKDGNIQQTIEIEKTTPIQCEKCNNSTFKQTLLLRKLSALVSPNGQETLVPVQVFACEKCGHVNSEFSDVTGIQ